MKNSSNKIILTLILGIFLISLTSAIDITRLAPTTDIFITNESTVNLSYGIHAPDGVSSITQSINGTNYTLYDYTLVGFWNFDNRSELLEMTNVTGGTIVRDISMYANNGTIIGFNNTDGFVSENITLVNGKYNNAFYYLGTSGYINITHSSNLLLNKGGTISLWFKQVGLGNHGSPRLIDKSGGSNGGFYIIANPGTNGIIFNINNSANSPQTGFLYQNNTWTHLVITFNETGYTTIYINSIIKNQSYTDNATNIFNTAPIGIGNRPNTADRAFNGSIDDVIIFNRTLSVYEVSYLYNTSITKYNSTYWELNSTVSNSVNLQNYFTCSVNSTNSNFCTSISTFREVETIKANFSNSIGTIRNDFYGVNTKGKWGSSLAKIDIDGNGITDTLSNYQWHRKIMKDANIKYWRADLAFWYNTAEGVYTDSDNYYSSRRELVKYAYENDIKIIWTITSTPPYLQNKTSGYCNSNDWNTCSATNNTQLGISIVGALNEIGCNVYSNICEVELRNEPGESGWLNNLSNNDTRKIDEYVLMANEVIKVVNSSYPNIETSVGSLAYIYNTTTNPISALWMYRLLDEIGTNMTKFSFHTYYNEGSEDSEEWNSKFINAVLGNLSTRELLDDIDLDFNEHGVYGDLNHFDNRSNEYAMQTALEYFAFLNNRNLSKIRGSLYQWSEDSPYAIGLNYSDYPQRYGIVSEPLLNNTLYIPYNVTKNFAHLHPSGADVKVTSSDSDCIKQVSSVKGNLYAITLINTCDRSQNVTLNLSRENGTMIYPYRTLVNYEDEDIKYKISDANTVENLLFDPYDILYLRSGEESGATLRGLFKLNEYTGNVLYDSRQNLSNGVRSGATWVTDGILNKIPTSKYTINLNSGLTSLSNDYLYEYLTVSYNTVADKTSLNALTSIENSGSTAVNFLPLVFLVTIFGAILFLVLKFLIPYIELGQNINKF